MTFFMNWTDPNGERHVRDLGTGKTLCGANVGYYSNVRPLRACPCCVIESRRHLAASGDDWMTAAESLTSVWWVFPHNDRFQHATTTLPPPQGGNVETLGGYTVQTPPRGQNKIMYRPWCDQCMAGFLSLPYFVPSVWTG